MIRSRLPQRIVALHSLIADQNILHGIIQRMSHMQLSRDIWRRDHNGKGCLCAIHLGVEILFVHPLLVQSVLDPLGIIRFRKFSAHINPPFVSFLAIRARA